MNCLCDSRYCRRQTYNYLCMPGEPSVPFASASGSDLSGQFSLFENFLLKQPMQAADVALASSSQAPCWLDSCRGKKKLFNDLNKALVPQERKKESEELVENLQAQLDTVTEERDALLLRNAQLERQLAAARTRGKALNQSPALPITPALHMRCGVGANVV